MVALTYDSPWIEMLRMVRRQLRSRAPLNLNEKCQGLLGLADFSREQRLHNVLSKNYQMVMEDGKCPRPRSLGLVA